MLCSNERVKMDLDVTTLKRQLSECQKAHRSTREELRVQSVRTRQLVAACSLKLQEKDNELSQLRRLKDAQLQTINRQLLQLQSAIRKEQKSVVEMIEEKDLILHSQQVEIARLKRRLADAEEAAETNTASDTTPVEEKEEEVRTPVSQPTLRSEPQPTPFVTKMIRRFEDVDHPERRKSSLLEKEEKNDSGRESEGGEHDCDSSSLGGSQSSSSSVSPSCSPPLPGSAPRSPVSLYSSSSPSSSPRSDNERKSLHSGGSSTKKVSPSKRMSTTSNSKNRNYERSVEYSNAKIAQNFEEFSLESLDSLNDNDSDSECGVSVDDGGGHRKSGDGAESSVDETVRPGYERFLEATGLSQKALITPSRMFSNHKSVLKPKDIKHRSKLKAVFSNVTVVEETSPGNYKKYWTEPYV